mmetsp:Transcript_5484/g.6934  ORF Transcript_5484/g.6934 Transcript_5484/m.6934 type:complete len:86 (-) Transcript_5484:31-288(-)
MLVLGGTMVAFELDILLLELERLAGCTKTLTEPGEVLPRSIFAIGIPAPVPTPFDPYPESDSDDCTTAEFEFRWEVVPNMGLGTK